MIAVYDFTPSFCPNCGAPTRLKVKDEGYHYPDPPDAEYLSGHSYTCWKCHEVHYGYIPTRAIINAARSAKSDLALFYSDL